MAPRLKPGQSGFTLVELLVALTLLAMTGLVMLMAYRAVVPAWEQSAQRAATARSLDAAQALAQRLLSEAYPAVIGDPGARHVDFDGAVDHVAFLAPLGERFGAGVIGRYRLFAPGDGTLRLSAAADLSADEDASEAIVLGGLSGVAFTYYGSDDPAQAPAWRQRWTNRTTLPQLIRIHLARAARDDAGWSDILVAPLVTADADCAFDPRDGKCRGQ